MGNIFLGIGKGLSDLGGTVQLALAAGYRWVGDWRTFWSVGRSMTDGVESGGDWMGF